MPPELSFDDDNEFVLSKDEIMKTEPKAPEPSTADYFQDVGRAIVGAPFRVGAGVADLANEYGDWVRSSGRPMTFNPMLDLGNKLSQVAGDWWTGKDTSVPVEPQPSLSSAVQDVQTALLGRPETGIYKPAAYAAEMMLPIPGTGKAKLAEGILGKLGQAAGKTAEFGALMGADTLADKLGVSGGARLLFDVLAGNMKNVASGGKRAIFNAGERRSLEDVRAGLASGERTAVEEAAVRDMKKVIGDVSKTKGSETEALIDEILSEPYIDRFETTHTVLTDKLKEKGTPNKSSMTAKFAELGAENSPVDIAERPSELAESIYPKLGEELPPSKSGERIREITEVNEEAARKKAGAKYQEIPDVDMLVKKKDVSGLIKEAKSFTGDRGQLGGLGSVEELAKDLDEIRIKSKPKKSKVLDAKGNRVSSKPEPVRVSGDKLLTMWKMTSKMMKNQNNERMAALGRRMRNYLSGVLPKEAVTKLEEATKGWEEYSNVYRTNPIKKITKRQISARQNYKTPASKIVSGIKTVEDLKAIKKSSGLSAREIDNEVIRFHRDKIKSMLSSEMPLTTQINKLENHISANEELLKEAMGATSVARFKKLLGSMKKVAKQARVARGAETQAEKALAKKSMVEQLIFFGTGGGWGSLRYPILTGVPRKLARVSQGARLESIMNTMADLAFDPLYYKQLRKLKPRHRIFVNTARLLEKAAKSKIITDRQKEKFTMELEKDAKKQGIDLKDLLDTTDDFELLPDEPKKKMKMSKAFYPEYEKYVKEAASKAKNKLPEDLIHSMIRAESHGKPAARSHVGARGLMQLMPATAKWIAEKKKLGKLDLNKPEDNIRAGVAYLDYLYDKFKDYKLAVAAYNAGEGNMSRWIRKYGKSWDNISSHIDGFQETKNYIKQVFGKNT